MLGGRLGLFGTLAAMAWMMVTGPSVAADGSIAAIQRQLIDSQCWAGPIDDQMSQPLAKAIEQCPLLTPFLRLASPTHLGPIDGIAADRTCSTVVSVSRDKTARVWNAADGTLRRVIRPPIGPGQQGEVQSVAISPNGRLAALGVSGLLTRYDGTQSVGIYDLATGLLVNRVGPLEEPAMELAFSPDGAMLAVRERQRGLRLFSTRDWRLVAKDIEKGKRDPLMSMAFAPDGSLVTLSKKLVLKRYDSRGKRRNKVTLREKSGGVSIAINAAGTTLALGFLDQNETLLLDPVSLKEIGRIPGPPREVGYGGGAVAFNDRGILATATADKGNEFLTIRTLKPDASAPSGWSEIADTEVAEQTIMGIGSCGSDFVFGTGDPVLGVLSPERGVLWRSQGHVANMQAKYFSAFTVSQDGARVRFGLKYGETEPVLFDLDMGRLLDSPSKPADMLEPDVKSLPITKWGNYFEGPLLDGRPVQFSEGDMSRAVAVLPGGAGFILGSSMQVARYDRKGRILWEKQDAQDEAYGVNIAGSAVISAHADGTIRWWRLDDGTPYLTLFVDPIQRRWVIFTPEGYYMSSPGGDELIGWQVNRGWVQSGDFFPADRFRDKFYRPDIIKLALATQDSAVAIRQASLSGGKPTADSIADVLPPVVTISNPKDGSTVSSANLLVDFNVRSPTGKPLEGVQALVNNRPISLEDLAQAASTATAGLEWNGRARVIFPADGKELALIAKAGGVTSEPARVSLQMPSTDEPPSAEDLLKPSLYALVVGVSLYDNAGIKSLNFAAKDANDLAAVFESANSSLYSKVRVRLLTDGDATLAGIKDGLAWLEDNVRSRDIGLVYLAGHGETDPSGTYWFLASDTDPARLSDTALSRDDLLAILPGLAGQPVMLLDTCYSGAASGPIGAVDANAIVGDLSRVDNRVITLSAATGREISQENPAWGNGAFTKALIEGLRDGRADLGTVRDGRIKISELGLFVTQTVGDLTGGTQHPVLSLPDPRDDLELWSIR